MSSEEYACIQEFELQRFRSECDILRIPCETFTQKLMNGDKKIDDFIKMQSVSADMKYLALEMWKDLYTVDTERIKKKWEHKIASTRSAFMKDRTWLERHLKDRIPNNRNEEMRQTRSDTRNTT